MKDTGIRKVGVIGIGLMGSGIAQVAATRGFDVLVIDVTDEILEVGIERIQESLGRLVESHNKTSGKMGLSPEDRKKIQGRLRTSTESRKLIDRDLVIEAMVEDEAAKKKMISKLVSGGVSGNRCFQYLIHFHHAAGQCLPVAGTIYGDALYEPSAGSGWMRADSRSSYLGRNFREGNGLL